MDASAERPLASSVPGPVRGRSWRWQRVADLARLARLNRPIGIWLLLWPTLWALWIASAGTPRLSLLLIFVAGTVLMRSAGCIINDLADRNFDPHVRRTRDRPLAARRVAPHEALMAFTVLVAIAFVLALQLKPYAFRLAFVGGVLTITYPLLKRFFVLPQLYLGVAFGWAVPMAFAAVLGQVPRVGWLLLLATMVWAGVYDTFYAMVDRDDDVRIGVRSSAIAFGDMDLPIIGGMQLMLLAALLLTGRTLQLGAPFYLALLAGAGCLGYQLWIARHRKSAACFRAFKLNNYFGLVILIGLIIQYRGGR
jgi:4-hydroxybenzoate polyprenyltransferase